MFINTGGVYQRKFHWRYVREGGIYITFIREILVEVYRDQARLCLQKCSILKGLFFWGGGGFCGEQYFILSVLSLTLY